MVWERFEWFGKVRMAVRAVPPLLNEGTVLARSSMALLEIGRLSLARIGMVWLEPSTV